jgi:hypothetical protein
MRAALWLQLQLAFNVVSDSPDYIKATFSRTRRRMQSRTVRAGPTYECGEEERGSAEIRWTDGNAGSELLTAAHARHVRLRLVLYFY